MIAYQNKSLDLNFTVMVPESAEEFDRLAGVTGACVGEANRNVIYRSVNHEFRDKLCERMENETGVPRESKTSKKADGTEVTEYTENEKAYINRLLAGKHIDEDKMQLIATEVGKTCIFDPSPSTRTTKIPKEIASAAADILFAVSEKKTTPDRVMANFAAVLGVDFQGAYGAFSEDSVAKALIALRDKQARERANSLIG